MNRTVAVVGGTIVGLAVVFVVAGALKNDGKREVDVVLSTADGVCKAVEPVDKLGGSWVRSKLTWHVTNNCTSAQIVGMQDFKKRPELGSTENDLVKPYPPMSQSISATPPNNTGDVETHLKKFKFWDTYKYSICTDPAAQNPATCIDPDVDVWPF